MTKLCPRGKAAAKRKFKVYPSAYANAYASKICAGKIKDPSGVKRKDFKGPKPAKKGAMIKANEGKKINQTPSQKISEALKRPVGPNEKIGDIAKELKQKNVKVEGTLQKGTVKPGKVAPPKFDPGKLGPGVDISNIVNKEKQKRENLAKKLKAAYDKVPPPVKRKVGLGVLGTTGVVGAGIAGAVSLYELGKAGVESGKRVYTAHKADKYRKEDKKTATFQKRSKKKEQLRDQKSEKFLAGKGFDEGGFSKIGMHDVMGSPISVDVDDDNLTNSSAMAYYKDLL